MRALLAVALCAGCGSSDRVILQDKGSDTIVNLMARMSETFIKKRPDIVVAVNGGGSGTGIKSLIDGTTDIANASREMKEAERKLAAEMGVTPNEIVLAHDGLAIYVHAENPIERLDFEQLRCIYAEDGKCNHWSDLGVKMDCGGGTDHIVKLNRQNNSGTYEYFKAEVMGKHGRFTQTLDQSGTQQVADVVSTAKCAIGYGGMGYGGGSVRYVCLARTASEPCAVPTTEAVSRGEYPFSRPLYLYTNGEPRGPVRDFIDYVLSPEGQAIVLKAGFVPVASIGVQPAEAP